MRVHDADGHRRRTVIIGRPAAGIPVYGAPSGTEPLKRCSCTLARGVWIDRWANARCELCNLKIREWETK